MELLAHVTCFEEVVSKSKGGWQRHLGPNGSGLSGGERKRLALLRGLLQNRDVIVMDEVTSELDPAIEAAILSRLSHCCASKIVIVITHRASAALWADRIIALRDGGAVGVWSRFDFARIVESGGTTVWDAEPSLESSLK